MKLKITKDYYEEKDFIYQYSSLTINPGVTVLVGCNGSGKTTLLSIIRDHCNRHMIHYDEYSDQRHGRSNAMTALEFIGDVKGFVQNWMSSEGEQIYNNIGRFVGKLRNKLINSEKYVLLFDGIDSGQSIDSIIDIKDLFECIIEDAKKAKCECYIVVTANTYELARDMNCIDATTGKRKKFKSYETYKKFILASSEYKKNRYDKLRER